MIRSPLSLFLQAKKLRWFLLPFEAKQILCSGETLAVEPPFRPPEWPDISSPEAASHVGSYGRRCSVDERFVRLVSSVRNTNHGAFKTKDRSSKVKITANRKASSRAETNGSGVKKENGVDEDGTATCGDSSAGGLCVLNGERGPPRTVHGGFETASNQQRLIELQPFAIYTGFSREKGAKLRDWAVGDDCYSQAALSLNDSKTRYYLHFH